ncbi:MAG TPA: PAS domain S-box protein [Chloroflexota bacterium]|nr:PAS domain S-box protein [Chloroflexota bacterium]
MSPTPENREEIVRSTSGPGAPSLTEQRQEQELTYRRIFEATSDGIIINDPETGCVVDANTAVCRMHGYTREEFIGLHATAFIHPDYHHVFADFRETIMAGGSYQTRALDTRKDGSVFHVEVNGSPVLYHGRRHILAVVRDVSTAVEAEDRLREKEEQLEQRVQERTRELSLLLDISHHVASTLQLSPLLELILDQTTAAVQSDAAALLSLDGDELIVLARHTPEPPARPAPSRYRVADHGVLWDILVRGEPVIINDVRGTDELARIYQRLVGEHLEDSLRFEGSFMAVPMLLKDRIVGLLALAAAPIGYFSAHHAILAAGIAQQAAVAIENARLYGRAQEVAVLEERQRLSRELHDSVSQALYSIALSTRTARTLLDRDPSRAAEPLDFALAQAETGLAEMRALIFDLRPEALEEHGLAAGLERQGRVLGTRHGLAVELSLPDEPDAPLAVKEALYRIAQEALTNAGKHAQAGSITICLQADGHDLVLEIQDDGVGFDSRGEFPGHLGLRTMRERAVRLGGSLEVTSTPCRGTLVRARIPVKG